MKGQNKTNGEGGWETDVRGRGFLTVKGAQEFLSVSETTIYRAIEGKKLTRFKLGRRTLLSRTEVENLARAKAE